MNTRPLRALLTSRRVALIARLLLAVVTLAVVTHAPSASAHRSQAERSHDGHRDHNHSHGHRGHAVGTPAPSPAVLQWYDLTTQAVAAAAQPEQATQDRIWAVSWLAAARAVGERRDARFQTAAFATALHDALVALVPAQAPQLDGALAATRAGVPDGAAKAAGAAAGRREAAAVLAERTGDGLETAAAVSPPWSPPAAAPGVWQPTPPTFGPVVRAGLPHARSFLLHGNDELRPGPPPSLTSKRYLRALAEVRAVGRDTSSVRTAEQTDVARFWAQASIDAYVQVLRAVLAGEPRSLLWQARLVAAFHVLEIDQQIAVYDAKYTYVFWRPVTAIQHGAVDPDPSWTPFLATPRHPEYPSGHTGYAGTAEEVLTAFVGRRPPTPIVLTSATAPGATRTYDSWAQLTQENVDGRVWEGVHYRFSDETAVRLGRDLARRELRRLHRLGL